LPSTSTANATSKTPLKIVTPVIALRPPQPRHHPNRIAKNPTSPSHATSSPPSRRRRQHVQDMQRLWDACGGDIARWNRGDFCFDVDGEEDEMRDNECATDAAARLSLMVGRGKAGRW
jgi:hypothetical protein